MMDAKSNVMHHLDESPRSVTCGRDNDVLFNGAGATIEWSSVTCPYCLESAPEDADGRPRRQRRRRLS